MSLPPLSHSILGVEPLDEFIREIADFIHHMIMTRPDVGTADAKVEVEMKVGILRDRVSGARLKLPVLVETSQYASSLPYLPLHICKPRLLIHRKFSSCSGFNGYPL